MACIEPNGAAAVEVSKPETVEMEVVKVGEEEVDAAKGLKRKLEDAVAADDSVKSNGTHEEEANGHGKAENGTKNGNHAVKDQEVEDSPVKKPKTEDTTEVATEKVAEEVKMDAETVDEKVEEAKKDETKSPVEGEAAVAVVASTEDKASKDETTTAEPVEAEAPKEKEAETAETKAVSADEKKEEQAETVAVTADATSGDPEEKVAE